MSPIILTPDHKTAIDNLIVEFSSQRDWTKWRENAKVFVDLFAELGIDGDPLVSDHTHSQYRYLPLSIYMLLSIGSTSISDAFYEAYPDRINKEFVYATGDKYNYLQTFYGAITTWSGYPTTDNMIGAIFHLRDLSFFKDVSREHKGGKQKAVQWLRYLHNQIDFYMEEGDDREQFRTEIETELAKAEASLLFAKKEIVLNTLNLLFDMLSEIDDPLFVDDVKKKFDDKFSHQKGAKKDD